MSDTSMKMKPRDGSNALEGLPLSVVQYLQAGLDQGNLTEGEGSVQLTSMSERVYVNSFLH